MVVGSRPRHRKDLCLRPQRHAPAAYTPDQRHRAPASGAGCSCPHRDDGYDDLYYWSLRAGRTRTDATGSTGTGGAALLTGVPDAAVAVGGVLITQGAGSIQAGMESWSAAMSAAGSGPGGPAAAPSVSSPAPRAAPAPATAPPISRQKQDGQIVGTPQYANRVANGKMTSTFIDPKKADALTQEAWTKGTPIGSRGDMKLYDFGAPVGIGLGGDGCQT